MRRHRRRSPAWRSIRKTAKRPRLHCSERTPPSLRSVGWTPLFAAIARRTQNVIRSKVQILDLHATRKLPRLGVRRTRRCAAHPRPVNRDTQRRRWVGDTPNRALVQFLPAGVRGRRLVQNEMSIFDGSFQTHRSILAFAANATVNMPASPGRVVAFLQGARNAELRVTPTIISRISN